jgi:hypothetical protein
MKNVIQGVLTVLLAIFGFLVIVQSGLYSGYNNEPGNIQPGDTVASLTGKSVIENGSICQQYHSGFVNTFGPDGEEYWFKPEKALFPTAQVISIIHENGTYEWVRYTKIVKTPATAEDMLCESPLAE